MSMWTSFDSKENDKIDIATHSYNGLIRVLCMNPSGHNDYEELTVDEVKNLIAKLEGAILKTETPS